MGQGPPSAARGISYFLISYPHTERNGQGNERDPDYWVIRFHQDLCLNVEKLTGARAGTPVGILDRDLWVGDDWVEALPNALASSRVLVPLYSPRYFESEWCGKEWYAFASRPTGQIAQAAQGPAIIPVMWMPTEPGSLPQAARTVPIHYGDGGGDAYATRGLYGIIKGTRYRAEYDGLVREVAQRVVGIAKRSPAIQWPPVDLASLLDPFGPPIAPESGAARLLITVAAPHRDDLPPDRRDRRYYGATAWDWAPYQPASQQPVAQYAANFARSLGYRPYLCDVRERTEDLLAPAKAAHPELLIIDPWSLMDPQRQQLLAGFNLADKPWVQVVIPSNPDDAETTMKESRLREALQSALGRKLELGRVTSGVSVAGVPSLAAFGVVLPTLIPTVGNCYLGNASAFPPVGPTEEKPTLQGFTPNPPHTQSPLERARA